MNDKYLNILLQHAGIADGDYLEKGMTGQFRPFSSLEESSFHSVVECLYYLHGDIHMPAIDVSIVRAFSVICLIVRSDALSTNTTLRKNRDITSDDILKIEYWLFVIEKIFISYCVSANHFRAMYWYMKYILMHEDYSSVNKHLLIDAINDIGDKDDPEHTNIALYVVSRMPDVAKSVKDKMLYLFMLNKDRLDKNAVDIFSFLYS